jgi:dolichol-phosphate mannosyltransferase
VIVAILGIIWQIFIRFAFPSVTPSGFTTIIMLILFMGGIQLLCLSIIGSYIAHIYDEVKSRPTHVVESFFNYPASGSDGSKRLLSNDAEHAVLEEVGTLRNDRI